MTEDKMFGWRHQPNGHDFEQAPGDGEGQWNMMWGGPCSHRVGHEWALNNNNNNFKKESLLLF